MVHFQYSLLLGNNYCEIKNALDQFESIYIYQFINNLIYTTEKEGIDKKKKCYIELNSVLKNINKKIRHFNSIVKFLNKDLSLLKEIDLKEIKKIIKTHKGDYPKVTGSSSRLNELFGIGDSPSVLSRKHTSLLIRNLLMPTKLSIDEFMKSVIRFVAPFKCINKEKIRVSTKSEIDKIEAIYSIGGLAEAIFVIGRLLENIINQYLNLLKKNRLIDLKNKVIKSDQFKLENKINYLYSEKFITSSQYSKMKSIKWDRNLYGHNSRVKPKDASAMVILGLQGIEQLDYKIQKLRKVSLKSKS